jgi:glucose/arabinose dehydrogenase
MGGDELNIIKRGANYGWPVITYSTEYDGTPINNGLTHADGMEQPVRYWVPSIAPSGLAIYTGPVREWQGTMWLGGLVGQVLVRLTLENGRVMREERFLKDELGRIRDVRMSPDGFIYFSTDDSKGEIFRVEPKKMHAVRVKRR